MDIAIAEKMETVIELMKQTAAGPCAIAIAGAHAKGTADSSSDLDVFMFADSYKSYEERCRLIKTVADPHMPVWISKDAEDAPWGGSMDFGISGTPVEVNFRTFAMTDRMVADCMDGKFQIIPATWTSNGYYTFIYLSELSFIRPVWDPENRLSDYQRTVSVYPEPLRRSIIKTFMGRAGIWLNNFHYETAIERCDALFIAPIVVHTLMDMVQVIFALNRKYFTGDKKLEKELRAMALCPSAFKNELAFLLNADQNKEGYARQRAILRTAMDELRKYILLEDEKRH